MATPSSSDTLGSDTFNELVAEGRKLAGYFFLDANALDHEIYGDPETRYTFDSSQIDQHTWWNGSGRKWNDNIKTGRAGTVLQTVSKALGSLTVGCDNFGEYNYLQTRTIDTTVMPTGCNIPITMTHEVSRS